jgi:hypothetical protein
VVRNNRENSRKRRRKVIPGQEEQEGRMKWICVAPQGFLQNGDITLARGTKNYDSLKKSSLADRLLLLSPVSAT